MGAFKKQKVSNLQSAKNHKEQKNINIKCDKTLEVRAYNTDF